MDEGHLVRVDDVPGVEQSLDHGRSQAIVARDPHNDGRSRVDPWHLRDPAVPLDVGQARTRWIVRSPDDVEVHVGQPSCCREDGVATVEIEPVGGDVGQDAEPLRQRGDHVGSAIGLRHGGDLRPQADRFELLRQPRRVRDVKVVAARGDSAATQGPGCRFLERVEDVGAEPVMAARRLGDRARKHRPVGVECPAPRGCCADPEPGPDQDDPASSRVPREESQVPSCGHERGLHVRRTAIERPGDPGPPIRLAKDQDANHGCPTGRRAAGAGGARPAGGRRPSRWPRRRGGRPAGPC